MPDFASLYWGSNHTQGKTTEFTKKHWASYITELEKNKAASNKSINGNGKIDSAQELAQVIGINDKVAAALWKQDHDIAQTLLKMDKDNNGMVSQLEYELYVAFNTKLHPHLGNVMVSGNWGDIHAGRIKTAQEDCGTGIPCNFKVYAAARHDEISYGEIDEVAIKTGKGSHYLGRIFESYKKTGDVSSAHNQLEKGYAEPYMPSWKTAHAVQSNTGTPWDASVKIDHAVIFYDADNYQSFKNDAINAKAALEAKNPNITIKLVATNSSNGYQAGLDAQAHFVKTNPGKENVVIINASHGIPNKAKENAEGLVKYNDKGDLQGNCSNGALTEAMLEAHMQDINEEVNNGFVVMDTCGSGAYTDVY